MQSEKKPIPEPWDSRWKLRQEIPHYYNFFLVFAFTNVSALTAILYSTKLVKNVQPLEWLTIPGTFLLANFIEYWIHRRLMHSRWTGFALLFKAHQKHHVFFTNENMGLDKGNDAYWILFTPAGVLLLFGAASSISLIVWYFINRNIAGIFLAAAIAYFLLYEWLHLIYHVPKYSLIHRSFLSRRLKKHHQIHHKKRLMNQYNFNITFPIFDWIYRTYFHFGTAMTKEAP